MRAVAAGAPVVPMSSIPAAASASGLYRYKMEWKTKNEFATFKKATMTSSQAYAEFDRLAATLPHSMKFLSLDTGNVVKLRIPSHLVARNVAGDSDSD